MGLGRFSGVSMVAAWIILWIAVGVIGWGWINYTIYKIKPADAADPTRWKWFLASPLLGPLMFVLAAIVFHGQDKFFFGLRFK